MGDVAKLVNLLELKMHGERVRIEENCDDDEVYYYQMLAEKLCEMGVVKSMTARYERNGSHDADWFHTHVELGDPSKLYWEQLQDVFDDEEIEWASRNSDRVKALDAVKKAVNDLGLEVEICKKRVWTADDIKEKEDGCLTYHFKKRKESRTF